jgi:hypothetical protein
VVRDEEGGSDMSSSQGKDGEAVKYIESRDGKSTAGEIVLKSDEPQIFEHTRRHRHGVHTCIYMLE